MYFFLKYLVTLFYKKLRIKIVVSFLCESGPRSLRRSSIPLVLEETQYTPSPGGDPVYPWSWRRSRLHLDMEEMPYALLVHSLERFEKAAPTLDYISPPG